MWDPTRSVVPRLRDVERLDNGLVFRRGLTPIPKNDYSSGLCRFSCVFGSLKW